MKLLEKELKQSAVTSGEADIDFFLKQLDRDHNLSVLERVGMGEMKGKIEKAQEIASKGKLPDHTYHISQIRRIAEKYDLRFDHTSQYIGGLPEDFYQAVGHFLETNEITKCEVGSGFGATTLPAFYILAPKENFKPIPVNKDPLLFMQVSDDTFKLVHQWGADITWVRAFKTWGDANMRTFALVFLSLIVICLILSVCTREQDYFFGMIAFMAMFAFCGIRKEVVLDRRETRVQVYPLKKKADSDEKRTDSIGSGSLAGYAHGFFSLGNSQGLNQLADHIRNYQSQMGR